jgi:alpha-beta hydrolase superfamily lysophospholipase
VNVIQFLLEFSKILPTLVMLVTAATTTGTARNVNDAKNMDDTTVSELEGGFTSGTAQVNGTSIHYVRAGAGPALILVHGFPEDWYEFHRIMPRLAKRFTVIAVDLRGIGGSTATPGG